MAKKEVKTDLWVYELLKEANIKLEAQGSNIKEINEALKTASKNKKGNVGFPEYCGIIKDYLIVIEDKATTNKQEKLNSQQEIDLGVKAIKEYALNGAYYYAKHILKNTTYKRAIAFGISGNEKRHIIQPIYLEKNKKPIRLQQVESFISFNDENIDEYYIKEILKENTDEEKTTSEIIKDAQELHEYLRNYGNLRDQEKPLVVSGIMLALREMEYGNFSIESLTGDKTKTDGMKIMEAINSNLQRSRISPETKKNKLITQFKVIEDTPKLNEKDSTLGKTPLKMYTEFLHQKLHKTIRYSNSSEDFLGRFYGEFMSYSGGDGQSLGIILTPKHICNLFAELIDLKPDDVVIDPCCGTGGFLIAAMHKMIKEAETEEQKRNINKNQIYGIELQPYMFTIAMTNMIIRGYEKSNIICDDFLNNDPYKLQQKGFTVGMMNPPYSQGKKSPELCELNFIEQLLNSLVKGARCIVIVPQSCMTGKNEYEKGIKKNIIKNHTLEGVITLNTDTFHGEGTNPCIAIFTAGEPHNDNKKCKFIDFTDDGFEVQKHIGLVETESAKDKRQHLIDVWKGKIKATTKFCVETTIKDTDDWLHSYYYFNDEIPNEEDFEKTVSDYLTFQFNMISHGKQYLFNGKEKESGKH